MAIVCGTLLYNVPWPSSVVLRRCCVSYKACAFCMRVHISLNSVEPKLTRHCTDVTSFMFAFATAILLRRTGERNAAL